MNDASAVPFPTLSLSLDLTHDAVRVCVLAVAVGVLVAVYSVAYLGHHPRFRSYMALIGLFVLAMLAVVATSNLWLLLVGWEVMGLCSYLLISHGWERRDARAGAAKAFVMTRVADLGLVLAILVIGQTYRTYDINEAIAAAGDRPYSQTVIGLLIIVAVAGKSAQFPLHTWLPDAMPGPTPITALIHAATMVAAGVYVAIRLLPLYQGSQVAMTAMAVVACISMMLGALFALVHTDLKRALAWSTVSQLGLMLAGVSAGASEQAMDHLVSHGVFKALLFLGCGVLMLRLGSSALSAMGGQRHGPAVLVVSMSVAMAALAGIAPTSGFFSKDAVLEGVWQARAGGSALEPALVLVVWIAMLAGSVLTAAYVARLWLLVFAGQAPQGEPNEDFSRSRRAMLSVPLRLLAIATLVLSVNAHVDVQMALIGSAASLTGIAMVVVAWLRGGALQWSPAPLRAELGLDRPFSRWIPQAASRSGGQAARVDADVTATVHHGVGRLTRHTSTLVARAAGRDAQRTATVIVAAVVVVAAVWAVMWS